MEYLVGELALRRLRRSSRLTIQSYVMCRFIWGQQQHKPSLYNTTPDVTTEASCATVHIDQQLFLIFGVSE